MGKFIPQLPVSYDTEAEGIEPDLTYEEVIETLSSEATRYREAYKLAPNAPLWVNFSDKFIEAYPELFKRLEPLEIRDGRVWGDV